MKHPWRFFLAALVGSALLAVGFALTVDQLLAGGQPAPHLRSVSAASLAGAGLTLAPAAQPPFCGAAQRAASNGWVRPGFGGCAMSKDAAERAAVVGSSQVVESVLARVTTTNRQPPLRSHLAWLVVVRGGLVMMPAILSRPAPTGGNARIITPWGSFPMKPAMSYPVGLTSPLRVVVLDGVTGQVLTIALPGAQSGPIPIAGKGWARPLPPVQVVPPTAPAVRASPLLVPPRG